MLKKNRFSNPTFKYRFLITLFWAGILFLFFFNLDGGRPFATPDEGRYVEIPREMALSGDYVTPRLNAMKYFEKPPLLYWMQAFMIKNFGMQEGVMRINIALFGFLGCLFLYLFMRRFVSERSAFLATAFLATSGLYYFLSRLIILDMPLTAFTTMAFVSFYTALHSEPGLKRRLWFYGLAVSLALGILTKGITMLALTGPVFVAWLTITKNWRSLLPLYLPSVIALFLVIVVPWHYLAHQANPDFLYKYFYVEHFLRYTTKMHGRYQPIWFFIPIVLIGMLPWTFRVYDGVKQGLKDHKNLTIYLILWAAWIIFFYSLSSSKLIPYILPAFPALAALGALSCKDNKSDEYLWILIISIFSFFGILKLFPILHHLSFLDNSFVSSIWTTIDFINSSPNKLHPLFLTLFLLGVGLLRFLFSFFGKKFIGGFSVSMQYAFVRAALLIVFINIFAPYVQKTSIKPLAQIINKERRPSDAIVSLESYFQDLPVYTQTAPVVCVDAINELEFGMLSEAPKTKEWMLTKADFIKQYGPGSGKAFWAVVRKKNFDLFKSQVPKWNLEIKSTFHELVLFYHSGK